MLKPFQPTSNPVLFASFHALLALEATNIASELIQRDDDISFNRARNELYAILDANGCRIEWQRGIGAKLLKGGVPILTAKAA